MNRSFILFFIRQIPKNVDQDLAAGRLPIRRGAPAAVLRQQDAGAPLPAFHLQGKNRLDAAALGALLHVGGDHPFHRERLRT